MQTKEWFPNFIVICIVVLIISALFWEVSIRQPQQEEREAIQEAKVHKLYIQRQVANLKNLIGKEKTYKIQDSIKGFGDLRFAGITKNDGFTTLVLRDNGKDYFFPYSHDKKPTFTFTELIGEKFFQVEIEIVSVNETKGEMVAKVKEVK